MNPETMQAAEDADRQTDGAEAAGSTQYGGSLLLCLDRIAKLQSSPVAQLDLQEAVGNLDHPGV